MKKSRVLFVPSQKDIKGETGRTILDLAQETGVYIDSQCNGKGKCGKCRVRVLEGEVSPFTQEESLFIKGFEHEMGYRLACMTRITGDATVLVAGENVLASVASKKMFSKRSKTINPAVKNYYISINVYGKDYTEYNQEIIEKLHTQYGLSNIIIDPGIIENLKKKTIKSKNKLIASVWMDKEIVAIHPMGAGVPLGIALDIGTTTVALYLCDLVKGDVVASGSFTNPQVLFGPDIMSRIAYSADHPDEGVKRMQRELINSVNALIDALVSGKGYSSRHVVDMTVVGNTVMHHIFLGIAPDKLGLWPFEPSVKQSVNIKAHQLGLIINPNSYVHVLPVEAGFVGADNVGVLISEEPYNRDELSLIIDIGTNGEIVLGNRNQLLSCSCATGPALEGAQISCGMRAAPGAIEKIRIDPDTLEVDYGVVGKKGWATELPSGALKPSGICGSGIIDIVAQFFEAQLIGANGAFSRTMNTPRLRKGRSGVNEFVVAWKHETLTKDDIVFTQKDVRQVQLAKAALHAGCRVLMRHLNIDAIRRITIAGAFGMHIGKESALTVGLLPQCEPNNIVMVGNAAGHGAYLALVDRSKREEADRVARGVTHIELAMEEDFQKEFMNALAIPTQLKG
jgi:uncharacterized 2Fe-2S/4Fe-4S cluster protein (DUF4445 family)